VCAAFRDLDLPLPRRAVIIGDLNGAAAVFVRLLRGLRLIKKDGTWSGGRTVLVQMGDIPNRGPGSRAAMELMLQLRPQARAAGGDAIWLLGNHEVLSVLRHEAYVTAEEYMEFATPQAIDAFYMQRLEAHHRMLGGVPPRSVVDPVGGRLKAWEEENAPGKDEYREAMGRDGKLGKAIRRLPVALRLGKLLLVHGGMSSEWAQLGLRGMERAVRRAWGEHPTYYDDLEMSGPLRDPQGPLWNRTYCFEDGPRVRAEISESLDKLGCTQMVIGHTRTEAVRPGGAGRPLVRHGGRLVMTDVGLGDPGEPGCALVVEKGRIDMWSPGGSRTRLTKLR